MSEKDDYLKSYIGKECKVDIASWYPIIKGIIAKCENGWITIETKGTIELINIDRINKISVKK